FVRGVHAPGLVPECALAAPDDPSFDERYPMNAAQPVPPHVADSASACPVPDETFAAAARARQARLTKPPGSLGRLEDIAVQLASLQRTARPAVDRVWITVFAADHGVAAEGVSAFPQAVTGEMLRNFAGGGAAIGVLAQALGATLDVVNLGTVNDPGDIAGVRRAIVAPGSGNICAGAAMTPAQVRAAL